MGWDFYQKHWLGFGKLLVEMENAGVPVDRTKLERFIVETREKQAELEVCFRTWARGRLEDEHGKSALEDANIEVMNVNSTAQLRQLFFGKVDSGYLEFQGVQVVTE